MPEKNDGGDKTEKPTAKRLRDARKRGEVSKSKDLTGVVVLIGWVALGALLWPFMVNGLARPLEMAVQYASRPSVYAMKSVGAAALQALVTLVLAFLLPVVSLGLLTEFAQAGPVLTTDRMKPKLDHLNPGEGLKRMFSTDNLVEVAKSLAKAVLIVALLWIAVAGRFQDLTALARGGPDGMLRALGSMLRDLFVTVAIVFVLVAAADAAYQRFSFTKKMRMSRRDIRQEQKDSEGDPYIRRQRRQLAQEWAGRSAVQAVRGAAALVVNPTHVAVALDYDPEIHPAPVVAAKGMGALAQEMREAAQEEGVPIVRNVAVARALNLRGTINDVVPQDMFAAVAEVIVWARRMKEDEEQRRRSDAVPAGPESA